MKDLSPAEAAPETAAPKKKRVWLKPRRLNSAQAGGTFMTILDVMVRWGCVRKTALTQLRKAGIPSYRFSDQMIRFKAEDIWNYEQTLK